MNLLSKLKHRLGFRIEVMKKDRVDEIEPIHTPSFSIGDSLGDIKVGLMDLKTRSERIEGCMLSREYFDESLQRRDKTALIISKLDEALRVLAEFQPRKPNIEASLDEEAKDHVRKAIESLRLRQVMAIFATRQKTTPKQSARILEIKNNTATEHLRKLEKLGYVRRVSRGLYEKL